MLEHFVNLVVQKHVLVAMIPTGTKPFPNLKASDFV